MVDPSGSYCQAAKLFWIYLGQTGNNKIDKTGIKRTEMSQNLGIYLETSFPIF